MKLKTLLILATALATQFTSHATTVTLQQPTATFSQSSFGGFFVAETVDGLLNNRGWAISPSTGTTQIAVYETAQDISFDGATLLTFTMKQIHDNPKHLIGRFRFSVTTDSRDTFADGVGTSGDVSANWTVLNPNGFSSENGTLFEKLSDKSLRVQGTTPDNDTYVITALTALQGITGIRLEVIADENLPANGPGRNPDNGNFCLSELQVSAESTGVLKPKVDLKTARSISVLSSIGKEYQLQFADSPTSTTWEDLDCPVEGTGEKITFYDKQKYNPKRYYRVLELPLD